VRASVVGPVGVAAPVGANVSVAPPVTVAPTVATGVTSETSPSTSGTVRFILPAKPSWIWLDGKRLTGTSAIVSCGTHQVKVGYYPKHAVTVPCGGELVLSR
jgi:hypothetical protein